MATWGIAKAKAQLSEVIYEAEKTGAQTLSRSGRDVAVIVSMDEWMRLASGKDESSGTGKPGDSMADFLRNSPLHGLEIPKIRSKVRNPFR